MNLGQTWEVNGEFDFGLCFECHILLVDYEIHYNFDEFNCLLEG